MTQDTIKIESTDSLITVIKDGYSLTNKQLEAIQLQLANNNSKEEKIFNRISYDTAFTVFITLLTLIIGYASERIHKWYSNRKAKEQVRNYFHYHANSICEKLLPKMKQLYRDFYTSHDINSGIPLSPPKVLSGDLEQVLQMNHEKLFEAFTDKETLSKVIAEIDFISQIRKEVDKYHTLMLGENKVQREEYQELSDHYLTLLSEYVDYDVHNNPARLDDITFNLINSKILYFHTELAGKRVLSIFYKDIIRPIQVELVQTNKFRSHPIGNKVARMGKDLSVKYNRLKNVSVEINSQYRQFYFIVDNAIINLTGHLRGLK